MNHLLSIMGLVMLCAGWGLFQQWLKRIEPGKRACEDRPIGCGSCRCNPEKNIEERHNPVYQQKQYGKPLSEEIGIGESQQVTSAVFHLASHSDTPQIKP